MKESKRLGECGHEVDCLTSEVGRSRGRDMVQDMPTE